jgi:hypothetical protein
MSAPRFLTIIGVAIVGGWLAFAAAGLLWMDDAAPAPVEIVHAALYTIAALGAIASGYWAFVVTKKRQWQFFLQWGLVIVLILSTLFVVYFFWSLSQSDRPTLPR